MNEALFDVTLATIDGEGIHAVTDGMLENVSKKKISPSLITGIEQCPASWMAKTFILPEFLETDMIPAVRGSAFHYIMEHFYQLPKNERTMEKMREIIVGTVKHEEYRQFFTENPEQKKWLTQAVTAQLRLEPNPETIEIAEIVLNGKSRQGLEVFIQGELGKTATRSLLGFVDRLRVDPNNPDCFIVEDYKTGKTAKTYRYGNKGTQGKPEARQQVIYTMLLENQGINVSGASLIYPMAKTVVEVDIEDDRLRKQVEREVDETDANLTKMCESNDFEFSPSFLCSWCPLAKVCPKAQINRRSKKMMDAYNSQPDPVELSKGIQVNF